MGVTGSFDINLGYNLWRCFDHQRTPFRSFIIDFAEVRSLEDSGLAWLLIFRSFTQAIGADLAIINAESEQAKRCREFGLRPATYH